MIVLIREALIGDNYLPTHTCGCKGQKSVPITRHNAHFFPLMLTTTIQQVPKHHLPSHLALLLDGNQLLSLVSMYLPPIGSAIGYHMSTRQPAATPVLLGNPRVSTVQCISTALCLAMVNYILMEASIVQ